MREMIAAISRTLVAAIAAHLICVPAAAADLDQLIESACIDCHGAGTETKLDLTSLEMNFGDAKSFRNWVQVFDRVQSGEMPPSTEARPNEATRSAALKVLKSKLNHANRSSQAKKGRVPSRRLTRTEYEHTLHDLLGIGGELARHLPPESESGEFDVVATTQEMSSVHVRGLLMAADQALDEAIQLGVKPRMGKREIDYFNSPYIRMWVERTVRRGGGTIFKTDRDVVTFRGENYVFRSDANGFRPPVAGRYRIDIKAAAYQPRSSITVSLKRQNDQQGQSELIAAWDLAGSDYRDVSTTAYLRPNDYIYVSADELEPALDGRVIYNSQPASKFGGEGVRIRRVTVEGPLESTWPPERTRKLFPGIEWKASKTRRRGRVYEPALTKSPAEHLRTIVSTFAERAWRRPLSENEVNSLVALAKPSLKASGDFIESVRISLRAVLVAPDLLFQIGEAGSLSDEALARRLSYFLWRSIPDDELSRLAAANRLSDPKTLASQVDRMLENPKSKRFVHEFLGQWLDLDRIDATTPDSYLYPEYDDVLRMAMLGETREFFSHLIEKDLSVGNLADSDFTFLNRRLAEHYNIAGVDGEAIRKVKLAKSSVRGGILAHASIAKVTANGTVTTPVKRGSFVLTNLLGQPPKTPPPSVGAIEPDTRGATTIPETLLKHQTVETCAACHRTIDPPGFALECFDPVGNYRKRYRNSKGVKRETNLGLRFLHKDYTLGLPVDTSGVTTDGFEFAGIGEYKKNLRDESKEQIARNIVMKLIAFSTGAETQFSDREVVETILRETKSEEYPLRTLIHHVVASRLFRNR